MNPNLSTTQKGNTMSTELEDTKKLKKSAEELAKVVKTLSILFIDAATNFWAPKIEPKEWITGHEVVVKLTPSTSKDPEKLVSFEISRVKSFPEADIPRPKLTRLEIVPQRLYDLASAVRREFPSIHDVDSKYLVISSKDLPSKEDVLWAEEVAASYKVNMEKNTQIVLRVPGEYEDQIAAIDTLKEETDFNTMINNLKDKFELIKDPSDAKTRTSASTSGKSGTIEVREY
jgi:hypothetical protein